MAINLVPITDWKQMQELFILLKGYSHEQLEWAVHKLTGLGSLTYLQGCYLDFEKLRDHLLRKNENEWPAHIVDHHALIQFAPNAASTRMWDYFKQFRHSMQSLNVARLRAKLPPLTRVAA